MDLLGSDTAGRGQQQQQNCGPLGGEKPAAASIDGLSRPSLISSLWSIQVQNEGSASDFPMAGCGSQQSLPEMLNSSQAAAPAPFQHCNGFSGAPAMPSACGADQMQRQQSSDLAGAPMDQQPAGGGGMAMASAIQAGTSLRPVKSLSDLHTLTAAQIAQTASAMPCHLQDQPVPGPSDPQSYLGFRRQTETGTYYSVLSRQQRDSQICEWLQKLNVGGGAEPSCSGSESPSQEFYQQQQQQRPPFLRADTTEQ